MMGGWKTWIGAAGFATIAVYYTIIGNYEKAIEFIALAFGLVGIGHKIEKMGGK